MKTSNINFGDVNFAVDFNNFDIQNVQTEETINAVFVVDVSPSIDKYVNELNVAFNDFIQEMQQSHVSERLLVSRIEFCEDVKVVNGFQPISNVSLMKFKPKGNGTALYDAVLLGMKNAVEYRENLEKSGVKTKTILFILTDGMDNSSAYGADSEVKRAIDEFKDEKNIFSFTSILFGIGDVNKQYFEDAKNKMGVQHLFSVGVTAKEIRKMINFISSSISSTSSGKPITSVQF